MAQPYVGEIRMFAGNFAPAGWMFCEGQQLAISENETLFQLIGTTYGGDGQSTFALPDLRGRTPIHTSNSHTLGERAGEQAHTLSAPEMPQHTHVARATTAQADQNSNSAAPARMPAQSNFSFLYGSPSNLKPMASNALANTGGSQAHQNMQPFLTLTFCIALQGIFPSQN